jgi:5-methylcytosine-specific restriction protein A
MGATVFHNREQAYLKWLSQHLNGYVLNAHSTPSKKYLILHLAKCRKISTPPPESHPACFTGNGYIKVCADNLAELDDWIVAQGFDDFTKSCKLCRPIEAVTSRRFNWTRDELILALVLYHDSPAARGNSRHPGVVELSELLQELPIYPEKFRPPNFRNPNGVAMKLSNFLVCDSEYSGAGLQQRAGLEQAIWDEFSNNLSKLRQIAASIREHYPILNGAGASSLIEDDGVEEGGILHAKHKYYERNKSIVQRKKKEVFGKLMALKCEVCEFDFACVYGELGIEFAECHHTKPVSMMKNGEKTKLTDLSIVCANCHRMLHKKHEPFSIAELKAVLMKELKLGATKATLK